MGGCRSWDVLWVSAGSERQGAAGRGAEVELGRPGRPGLAALLDLTHGTPRVVVGRSSISAEGRKGCGELGSPDVVIHVVISPTGRGWQTRTTCPSLSVPWEHGHGPPGVAPGRMGLHRALRDGLHQHQPAVP